MRATSESVIKQAVILAGGKGSRLRPYTDTKPKVLVEVPGTGKPILGHQLDWLAQEGVTDVIISTGYLHEVLTEWVMAETLPVRVKIIVESEPLGRGGGLRLTSEHLPRPRDPWIAANGDVLTQFPLTDMYDFHHGHGAVATIALTYRPIPWGVVDTDEFGHVKDFREAPLSPWPVNAGVYVFSPEFKYMLPEHGDHERTTFPALARDGRLAGFLVPEGRYCRSIDTAKDLETAGRELAMRGM